MGEVGASQVGQNVANGKAVLSGRGRVNVLLTEASERRDVGLVDL